MPRGMRQGLVDGFGGDLVKHQAMDGHSRLQDFAKMPADGFPLAVFIRCQIEVGGILQEFLELADLFYLIFRDDVDGGKSFLDVHAQISPLFPFEFGRDFFRPLGQVANVADAGFNVVSPAEKTADRTGLGGRLDDHQGSAIAGGL